MSNRVSQYILLCEDDTQARLTKAYMKMCGLPTGPPEVVSIVASRMKFGGNVHWVLDEFPKQLHACRQRQKRAKTLLIVLVDADEFPVDERRRELIDRLKQTGANEFGADEPAVLLIPKRHIETWICALLGHSVSEEQDCKTRRPPTKEDFRQASEALFAWTRENAVPGPTCVASLHLALPEWKNIQPQE